MLSQYQIYKGADGQWYWRLLGKNGKIVAIAGEGFKRRSSAVNSAKRMPEFARTEVVSTLL